MSKWKKIKNHNGRYEINETGKVQFIDKETGNKYHVSTKKFKDGSTGVELGNYIGYYNVSIKDLQAEDSTASFSEGWDPISTRFDEYEISTNGNFRYKNSSTGFTANLHQEEHSDGYLYVKLCNAGDEYCYSVDKLVLDSWVADDPEFGELPIHKNGNKKDNRQENLAFGIRK